MRLNPQQHQAVRHKSGPLLIIAGAGTGKTTVITERIKYLIQVQGISPQNILAVTFTDKAATEMLERLDVVMPLGYQEPWLSTFHHFCDRILQQESLSIGLDPDYKIFSAPEQWIFIKQRLFDFKLKAYRPLGNPTKFISALVTFFSRAQDEAVTPKELLKFAKKQPELLEIASAYRTYQDLKIANSVLDFGDLITKTIELFKTRPSILKKYQAQFKHILVDEFQDTNYAQYQLIKLLAPAKTKPNLVVVSDDDQSIYQWRGAALSNVLNFKSDYPKAKVVTLVKNYRSFKPILTAAYNLIQHNNPNRLEVKLKINKKLKPIRTRKPIPQPQIVHLPTESAEVDWIIARTLELVAQANYTYKDFAILTRANSHLEPFVLALRRVGLPYQLIGNRGLFDQEVIRQLIFFLKVILNPHDSISLFQFLHHPYFSLAPETIFSLTHQTRRHSTSIWDMLNQEPTTYSSITNLITQFQAQALTDSPTKLLYTFLHHTQHIQYLLQTHTVESELAIKNINLFLDLIKRFETDLRGPTLPQLIEHLDALLEAGANPGQAEIEDVDTVRLITIHSAKGLEFPVVFIPSLVAGRFPAINRCDPIEFPDALIKQTLPQGDANLEEERRLFYVALTRARDYLYLTWSTSYGGARDRRPSGFLAETGLVTTTPKVKPVTLHGPEAPVIPLPTPKFKLEHLSYSQIDTFKACPLKYKYRYILKVPAAPHHALSFGQSLHDTLRHFHQLELQGNQPKLKDLIRLYTRNFNPSGYDSPAHKQARFRSGKKALRQYFAVYQQVLGQPLELEKSFRLNIAGVPLVGKIDRIDQTATGLEIIDYKTGAGTTKKDVDKDEQLSIYALAAQKVLGIKPQNLSLYFIELNQKLSTHRSDQDVQDTLHRLEQRVAEIKASDFPATPGSPFPCGFCEYNQICPFAAKKR
jgi:DNA helicase II / ATP-dependent DNA helicase PcrA